MFCAHGAGYVVPWNQVEDMMHTEYESGKALYLSTDHVEIVENVITSYSIHYTKLYEIWSTRLQGI